MFIFFFLSFFHLLRGFELNIMMIGIFFSSSSFQWNFQFSNVMFARAELNKTKEQLAEEKTIALGLRVKPLKIDNMDEDDLRKKAAELWEQIIQLESDKYDLEERRKRQDYDVSFSLERPLCFPCKINLILFFIANPLVERIE